MGVNRRLESRAHIRQTVFNEPFPAAMSEKGGKEQAEGTNHSHRRNSPSDSGPLSPALERGSGRIRCDKLHNLHGNYFSPLLIISDGVSLFANSISTTGDQTNLRGRVIFLAGGEGDVGEGFGFPTNPLHQETKMLHTRMHHN